MKKISLLAAAAIFAALPLSARELTFYLGNDKIENGGNANFEKVEILDYEDGTERVSMEPKIYLSSDIFTNTVSVTAKCVSGQGIQMCAGGNCMAGNEVTKTDLRISTGAKLDLQFEYVDDEHAVGTPIPTVVTEFTAVDTKYPDTEFSFTLTMSAGDSSVQDMFVNDADFHAVDGGIAYNFTAPAEVSVWSLAGEKVIATTLNGTGILSTADIPSGVYVYKAGNKSGKIYIR